MERIRLSKETPSTESLIKEYILAKTAQGLSKKSISNCEYWLTHNLTNDLNLFDGGESITKLYADIQGRTDITINSKGTYLRGLKTFVRWLNNEHGTNLPTPTIPHEEVIKETYTEDDLKKLIAKPKQFKSFCEYRNWLMVLTLIDTGIRASTLRSITVSNINLESRYLTSIHFKNKKQQLIPISSYLASELKKYLPYVYNSEYIFCDVYGQQLSDGALKLAIKRYNLSRGVQLTSIHAFRHTFAKRYLLDMGGDAFMLQKLLGHSTLAMTKHYCAIYDTDMLNVYKDTSPLESLQKHKKCL